MLTRPFTQLARGHRLETLAFAVLACASLLCLALALAPSRPQPSPATALALSPAPASVQVAAAPLRWQADLRTAYHAALYLLDPWA
jgi:hypothetical protein